MVVLERSGLQNYGVFLINLDRSPDRLAAMHQQLLALDLSYVRIDAVEGDALTPEQWAKVDQAGYLRCHGKRVTAAEIGCYLSHIKALQAFLASGHTHALILEDDAVIHDDFNTLWLSLLAKSTEWNMVYLSGVHHGGPVRKQKVTDKYDLVVYLTRQTGAAAYGIDTKAAHALLAQLLPMRLPFDHVLNCIGFWGVKQRAVHPLPVDQLALGTTTMDLQAISKGKLPWYKKGSTLWFRLCTEVKRFCYGLWALVQQ